LTKKEWRGSAEGKAEIAADAYKEANQFGFEGHDMSSIASRAADFYGT
jgi:hypothetical protein